MIEVGRFFFHCFFDYVLSHLEIHEKSILSYFSCKFCMKLPRVCTHTHLKFGGLINKYVGESINQN